MSLFVKICGMTDEQAVESAVDAGVDAVGFVFSPSVRLLSISRAVELAGLVPSGVLKVAVFRRPTAEELRRVVEGFVPDVVQADHDSIAGFDDIETLPVFRQGTSADPDAPRFLFEGPHSGSGQEIDLDSAARTARLGEMVLAGGLRPDNVGRAIDVVRPFGVDVSSGVESEPGVKDPALIRSFVAAVRSAEERLVRA